MLRWLFALLLLITTTLSALAKEPYGLALVDETGRLERVALENAAQPLLRRGAAIAIVLVKHGGRQDAVKQLSQLGLLGGTQISPSGLFIYVSLDPHYSELRAGARFSDDLPASQLETIRDQTLNPCLRGERYQQGYGDTLEDLERRLSHSLSLNDKIKGATLTLLVLGTFSLLGFWDWFAETPPARALTWLWSLTPMAKAKRRRQEEQARLGKLALLQDRAQSLEGALQKLKVLSHSHQLELDALKQQVEAASALAAPRLVELRIEVETQTQKLEQLRSRWNAGNNLLREAQQVFQSLRSTLKARKKTRALLQEPEVQGLEAEIQQESELRQRYLEQGAGHQELEQSERRCSDLLQRARELARRHGAQKKSPATPRPGSLAAESPTSSSSTSTSNYDDGSSSYDPPSSSSESWAGGDW